MKRSLGVRLRSSDHVRRASLVGCLAVSFAVPATGQPRSLIGTCIDALVDPWTSTSTANVHVAGSFPLRVRFDSSAGRNTGWALIAPLATLPGGYRFMSWSSRGDTLLLEFSTGYSGYQISFVQSPGD